MLHHVVSGQGLNYLTLIQQFVDTSICDIIDLFKFRQGMVRSLFVCVEVLRPSQPNGVMSSAVSLPNHMFTGQA